MTNILESFVNGDTIQCDISQCYFNATPLETLNWKTAYKEDPNTDFIMTKLSNPEHVAWDEGNLTKVNSAYKLPLKDGRIQIVNKKYVLFKSILANQRHIMLIIVPVALRRKMFSHYHAGPSGGHMGEYKTLYRIRLRFFWPRLWEGIKEWIKKCAHCIAYNVWRNRRQELNFSWSITIPFYIMHLDIWPPGNVMKYHKDGGDLLNCMCD